MRSADTNLHYHIRWSGLKTLDWERFETRGSAEECARQLAGPNEVYIIEAHGAMCEHCAEFGHQVGLPPVPKNKPIVHVVDDDFSVRESLEQLIRREGWKPATFESAQELLALPRSVAPSCLILALPLPDLNWLEVQKQIARERGEMPIIAASSRADIPEVVHAIKAGAVEFLTKPFRSDVLLNAVRESLERSRVALGCEIEMCHLRNLYGSLSRRERQVMALVAGGLLNRKIGAELGISEITVKAHRGQVMQKMKANSLVDLVRMAEKLGSPREGMLPICEPRQADAHADFDLLKKSC